MGDYRASLIWAEYGEGFAFPASKSFRVHAAPAKAIVRGCGKLVETEFKRYEEVVKEAWEAEKGVLLGWSRRCLSCPCNCSASISTYYSDVSMEWHKVA